MNGLTQERADPPYLKADGTVDWEVWTSLKSRPEFQIPLDREGQWRKTKELKVFSHQLPGVGIHVQNLRTEGSKNVSKDVLHSWPMAL